MAAPSLVDLCLNKVSDNLIIYSHGLSCLSMDLAEALVKRVLGQRAHPFLHELIVLCEAFWKPSSLSLRQHSAGLNYIGLQYLSYATSLVKLDLSCNTWLESLVFLPQLVQLQCLNLRDCWRLPEQCLAYIGGLSNLRCLDLQNVYSITDASASTFLSGMSSLQSLNLSGTGVSDVFLETLTYGQRLGLWIRKEQSSRYAGATRSGVGSFGSGKYVPTSGCLQQCEPLHLVYLRLEHTKISEASLPFLLSFDQLLFLDVRNTQISGKSLKSIQAKFKLIALPNDSKMLARWNSLIVATFQGACGCSSLGVGMPQIKEKPDWTIQWEQDGIIRLLEAASRLRQPVIL